MDRAPPRGMAAVRRPPPQAPRGEAAPSPLPRAVPALVLGAATLRTSVFGALRRTIACWDRVRRRAG